MSSKLRFFFLHVDGNLHTILRNSLQVSSSWIEKYHNFFKFPDWVSKLESQKNKDIAVEIKDINKATAEELTQIRGIGAVLSNRIVKYRSRLQGFGHLNQLYEV